jgi:hypothetical protein
MQANQIEHRDEHTAHQASRDHLGLIYWTLTGAGGMTNVVLWDFVELQYCTPIIALNP